MATLFSIDIWKVIFSQCFNKIHKTYTLEIHFYNLVPKVCFLDASQPVYNRGIKFFFIFNMVK